MADNDNEEPRSKVPTLDKTGKENRAVQLEELEVVLCRTVENAPKSTGGKHCCCMSLSGFSLR